MNNYNNLLSLYFFIFCIGFIHGSPKKNKHEKFDVDYFLKKVIVSKKFDEIADKIANKAVEKMQETQNFNKQTHSSKRLPAKNTAYRVSEGDIKGPNSNSEDDNITEPNISEENEKFTSSSKNPKNTTEETDKIKVDMKAYKQKETTFLKDLRLKYNRFHKKEQSKEEGILTDYEGTNSSRLKEKSSKEAQPDINNDSEETTTDILDIEKKSSLKSEKQNEKDTKYNDNEPIKDVDGSEKEAEIHEPEIDKEEAKESKYDLSVHSTDNNKDENLNADTKDLEAENNPPFYDHMQLPTKKKEGEKPKSKLKKRKHKRDKNDKTDNKDSLKSDINVKSNKKGKPDRKAADIFYRAEETNKGKKLYAYEKSPSYEDYHEQRAKIQKEKSNKTRRSNSYDDDYLQLYR